VFFLILLIAGLAVTNPNYIDGDVVINGDLEVIGGINVTLLSHAEGYFHSYDDPFLVDISSANVYYNVTNFTLQNLRNIEAGDNAIKILKTGTYNIMGTVSFTGGNGGIYEFEVHLNDAGLENCVFFRSTSSTAIGVGALSCITDLNANDELNLRVKDINNPPQNINIYQMNFLIFEIH